ENARPRWPHVAIERQEIPRFADRAHDVDGGTREARPLPHRLDVVVRLVKRRPNQVVHPGIDDDEGLRLSAFEIEHGGNQNTGVPDDDTARLEDQRTPEIARSALDHGRISRGIRRRLDLVPIGNPESSTDIDMADVVTIGAQRAHEISQQGKSVVERLELGYLAPDVHIDAGNGDAGKLGRERIDFACTADGNTELV